MYHQPELMRKFAYNSTNVDKLIVKNYGRN